MCALILIPRPSALVDARFSQLCSDGKTELFHGTFCFISCSPQVDRLLVTIKGDQHNFSQEVDQTTRNRVVSNPCTVLP